MSLLDLARPGCDAVGRAASQGVGEVAAITQVCSLAFLHLLSRAGGGRDGA